MIRSTLLAFLALCPCAGCAAIATQVNVSRSAPALGTYSPSRVRSVFTARLTSEEKLPSVAPEPRGSVAWGTVRIVVNDDDSFEYLATIYNPRGETFTSAFLRRGGASEGGEILATLFADVTLRGPYIQLRGTISVSRESSADALADELREHPHGFSVSVHTPASPRAGAIRGSVE